MPVQHQRLSDDRQRSVSVGDGAPGASGTSHDRGVLNHGFFAANVPTVITVPSPWSEGDVGNVGTPGWAVYQNGTFTVAGAGADIWGTTDAYHAVERFIGANGVIVARVTAENAANTFAKAGVIANSNAQSGPTVILDVRPDGLIEFMARPSQGGQMAFIAGATAAFPVWLKLQRTGGTFTGFISSDGNSWQNVGSIDVSMPTNINAGIAVTSHDTSALNTSTFDHVSASSAAPIDSDIGDVGAAGSVVAASETEMTVSGAGANIWGTADAFNYDYSGLSNDGGMYARVLSLDDTSAFAKAGIMIRASTDPSAAYVILDVKPDGGIEFMTRTANGASTTFLAGSTRSFPVFFRLERVGTTVNAWIIDGSQTTLLGSTRTDLPPDALIGLAVTSHQRGTLASAHFDFVSR
jgi:hypothetical protein